MIQLLCTMWGGDDKNQMVSQHRTFDAAVKANVRLQNKVRKGNGASAYLPVSYKKDWQPLSDADELERAIVRVAKGR